jgi:hypothetical protein
MSATVQVTYKRLQETLQQLSGPGTDRRADLLPGMTLVDALFDRREPRFAAAAPAWKPVNTRLDESQRQAVELALRAQDVALIHGPPGELLLLLLVLVLCAAAAQCKCVVHKQQTLIDMSTPIMLLAPAARYVTAQNRAKHLLA